MSNEQVSKKEDEMKGLKEILSFGEINSIIQKRYKCSASVARQTTKFFIEDASENDLVDKESVIKVLETLEGLGT